MTEAPPLSYRTVFSGEMGTAHWRGRIVERADQFVEYIQLVVNPYMQDADSPFYTELDELATTEPMQACVERLRNSVPLPESWQMGEALAHCLMQEQSASSIIWLWNLHKDQRNPHASMQGADLVGFCRDGETAMFLFGEVKTSSATATPPTAVRNMRTQLIRYVNNPDISFALLRWVQARCQDTESREYYVQALQRFLASDGKEVMLVGVLLRDTQPDERDLKGAGMSLGRELAAPTCTQLDAWYLPVRISEWPDYWQGGPG